MSCYRKCKHDIYLGGCRKCFPLPEFKDKYTFGLAPLKGEGMLVDPDMVTFQCNCEKCQEGYRKWKSDYLAEQKKVSEK